MDFFNEKEDEKMIEKIQRSTKTKKKHFKRFGSKRPVTKFNKHENNDVLSWREDL